ncbi:MAG: GntR family transcriptional regulator [Gammaproteobacteria bacterium]|nr:GntR family transcriptional regulator [Gammaproteobacteria bacterium]MCY4200751.1 GntR family transcriptional regulator [Gammaproteobacteria bacterium]
MRVLNDIFTPAELASLRTDGPIPLYHQLYGLLKQRILSGVLARDAPLPTEAELSAGFRISRITAKRGMDLLASDGLIVRRRGRRSSVAYHPKGTEPDAPLVGMLARLAEMSRETKVKVLNIDLRLPPPNVAAELGTDAHEQVHHVVRVRFDQQGIPFAYYESWTRGIEHGFTAEAIEQRQRFDIMAENGHRISHIEQLLNAASASPLVAELLELHAGDPVLTLVRQSFDEDGLLIDLLNCQYHPDRFHYRMNLSAEEYLA